MNIYKTRIFDAILREELSVTGAVLIEGAKWCGKTTTAEQTAKSVLYLDDPDHSEAYLIQARTNPGKLLEGASPRLLDEWQRAPTLWDAVRYAVDHADGPGQFILTGSSVPPNTDEMKHSGAGRFSWLRMRTMTLWESGDSSGEVSLSSLFDGQDPAGGEPAVRDLEEIAFLLCRGGWPYVSGMKSRAALRRSFSYLDATVKSDVSRCDGVQKDEGRVRRLLRSYARLQGTQASASVIRADMCANEAGGIGEDTVYSYLNALRRIFVVEDMPAWCPDLRSKSAVRTSDTRYFTDPSIATAALDVGPGELMGDIKTFGLLFETMAIRDLRVYADALSGSVSHFLDANGLECDAVIHLHGGRYGLVEIKLGGKELVEKGASSLKKLSSKLDTSKMRKPSFLMVLTAVGDVAYRREDGVVVCPISALKP